MLEYFKKNMNIIRETEDVKDSTRASRDKNYTLWNFKNTLMGFDFLFKKFLFLYFEREGKGGRKRNIDVWKKHQSAVSPMPPSGDLASNTGTHPDWELNWQPFGS